MSPEEVLTLQNESTVTRRVRTVCHMAVILITLCHKMIKRAVRILR